MNEPIYGTVPLLTHNVDDDGVHIYYDTDAYPDILNVLCRLLLGLDALHDFRGARSDIIPSEFIPELVSGSAMK